jgi:dTDP-4-dehydrorhamnose reductase
VLPKACVQIAHSLLINPEKKGVYHFSGKPDVSWYEFAKTIFELAGRDVQVNAITTSGYPTACPTAPKQSIEL